MSRTFSLIVLCPNGRRETVKVSSNNCILQVLEEACKKQNLNAGDYDIRHYNKTLDLSLPIRFANLPNNAQLELRKTEHSRTDSIVTVGLQLESGERLMGDFTPSVSVFDVLKQCLSSESISSKEAGEPVCIYMRQKIMGEALKSTTLRSLGLTKGTAMIRLLYRKPEELEEQAHVSSPLTAPSELTTPQPIEQRFTASPVPEQIKKQPRLDNTNTEQPYTFNTKKVVEEDIPMEVDSDESCTKPFSTQATPDVCEKHETLRENQKKDSAESIQAEVCDEKPQIEFSAEVEEDTFEGIGDIKYIGDRHAVVYSLDDITDIKKADLPDEFFDLTINDAKYLMSDYRKQRDEFENQPLLTKEQRQRQILQKLASYSQTVIRVYFPERLVLQAVFNVTETIQTVSDFVRNYLDDERLKFYLYITPPKEKLIPDKSLLEVMLVPAAVVYFGCDSQLHNYMKENLRSKLSDPRAAALAAFESRKDGKTNEIASLDILSVNQSNVAEENTTVQSVTPVLNVSQPFLNAKTQKVPKWLQLSKK